MDHDSLYETDICTWAEQQAAALRSLASRTDLPNQLDLPNIIEEVEDVGKIHLASISSFLRLILSHLVIVAADPDALSTLHWAAEVENFHAELTDRYTPSMHQRIDMAKLWVKALKVARAKLQEYQHDDHAVDSEQVAALLGMPCPFSVDEICDEDFKFTAAVEKLREHLGAAPPS